MKRIVLCILTAAVGSASAQTLSLSSASGGSPGTVVSVNITFAAIGTQVSGIQWTMNFSPKDFSSVKIDASSAAKSAGEGIFCSTAADHATCLMANFTSNTVLVPDGAIATATFQINSGTTSGSSLIELSNLVASDASGNTLNLTGSGVLITMDPPHPPPHGSPVVLSMVNAASYTVDGCSTGGLTSLFGTGFAAGPGKSVGTVPIPTELNGVRVRANGVPLPIFYASEKQINIQCPKLAPGTAITLIVDGPSGSSSPLSSIMQYATPGVFSLNGSGAGQGAVLIANTSTIAMPHSNTIPSQPVRAGDYVSIYVAGLGAVSGELSNGEPAPLSPLIWVQAPVDVLIGGKKAAVTFAGLAPGFTGLYQVNAKVPDATSAGNSVPVQIVTSLPDLSVARSNTVTIAVAPAK